MSNHIIISHHAGAHRRHGRRWLSRLMLAAGLVACVSAHAQPAYTLQDVLKEAMTQNPVVAISRAQQEGAEAAVVTAQSYINPEVEFGGGPTRTRTGPSDWGTQWSTGISQPLEFPGVRAARRAMAESNVQAVGASTALTGIDLRSRVKTAFYMVLQRQDVLKLAEGDRHLLQQIRDRVKLRVDTGEAAKYELIKAETEALAAERDYQAALVRVAESRAYLRRLVGPAMPEAFELKGELPLSTALPSLGNLSERIAQSPQLRQLRAYKETAEARLKLERELVYPGVTVKAGIDQDPDYRTFRLGLSVPIPVWNQRQGPIAEAAAGLHEVEAAIDERELSLRREIESAYQRYLIAQSQVDSFENGLLNQAESALKVAEAAYRFGERGILDYLDAQRTYRAVRRDYLSARYDYVSSMLEIERLLGTELVEVKS